MQIVILAAGFATRLRPLTNTVPKALLEINKKPILNYTLDKVAKLLPTLNYTLVTNDTYHEAFENWRKSDFPNLNMQVFNNGVKDIEKRLGAIGDLVFTLNKTSWDDDTLILASDTLTSLNWEDFLTFISNHKDNPSTIVCPTQDKSIIAGKLGCAVISKDELISFVEKPLDPPSNLRAVPFYYLPQNSLQHLRDYYIIGENLDSPGSLLPYLLQKTKVFAYDLGESGYYHDVGTLEVYNQLKQTAL